jgi:hypothetical protein
MRVLYDETRWLPRRHARQTRLTASALSVRTAHSGSRCAATTVRPWCVFGRTLREWITLVEQGTAGCCAGLLRPDEHAHSAAVVRAALGGR